MLKVALLRGALLASACVLAMAAPAAAQEIRSFDVPAGDLQAALDRYAQQAGIDLVYGREIVAGKTTMGVSGPLTPEEAIERLLAGTGLSARRDASGAILIAGPEERPTQLGAAQPAAPSEALVEEEIVVTGTHIRGAYPRSSPVSIYDRDDIERTGAATTDQFLRTLPQNLSSTDPVANAVPQQDPIQSQGNAFKGGGVNIHGLGFNATLVLLNGHRLAPAGSNAGFSDVTLLPVSAIDRVEVLSSGASAIYGADAVAGVVNFVTRDDFDGAEATARYGESTQGGGQEYGGSFALGRSWGDGSVLGTYDYLNQDGLRSSERDFVSASAGDRGIIPSTERNSVFLTAAQRVSPRVRLRADAYYSDRDFVDDSVVFGDLISHIDGDVTMWGFAPSAVIDLSADWKVDIAGNHSSLEQNTLGTSDSESFAFHSAFSTERFTEVTSLDVVADGSLWTLAGGDMRAAVGVAGRVETVQEISTSNGLVLSDADLRRESFSVFGELRIPLIGEANATPLAERLELSIAGRYDSYDQGGSKATPEIGLSWSPIAGVNVRGTFGESFRVATLEQLVGAPSHIVFPVPNPDSPTGITNTIFDSTAFNPDLRPEESTAYTFGFDLGDDLVRGLSLSATYFNIRFRDRIAAPILKGGAFNLFNETDEFGPFINLNPSQAEIDAIYASGFLINPFAIDSSTVEAIFEGRLRNLAESVSEGIDLSARYEIDGGVGRFGIFASGAYLLELNFKPVPTSSPVEVVDTLYNPPDLKLRGGVDWSTDRFGASLSVNYTDSYVNTLVTPNGRVDSWTTGDLQLSYRTGDQSDSGALENLAVFLTVTNVTDEPPPFVETPPIFADVGYDPANASPLGRFVSIQIKKQW